MHFFNDLSRAAFSAASVTGRQVDASLEKCDLHTVSCTLRFLAIDVPCGAFPSLLAAADKDKLHRDATLMTFFVTLSGVVTAGIGAAFWGVVTGTWALFAQQYGHAKPLP